MLVVHLLKVLGLDDGRSNFLASTLTDPGLYPWVGPLVFWGILLVGSRATWALLGLYGGTLPGSTT